MLDSVEEDGVELAAAETAAEETELICLCNSWTVSSVVSTVTSSSTVDDWEGTAALVEETSEADEDEVEVAEETSGELVLVL